MDLTKKLDLKNNIRFTSKSEVYYKKIQFVYISFNNLIFPMVLNGTKIYDIPNIIIWIDYINIYKCELDISY